MRLISHNVYKDKVQHGTDYKECILLCYIVLTVRGNIQLPKAKRSRYCIIVLLCDTPSNYLI